MNDVLVIDESTVRELLDPSELLEAIRRALISLSAGDTSVPPRVAAFTRVGLLGAMPGYLPGFGLAVKLVSVFDENQRHGLPSHQAVILLFDPDTGVPLSLMNGTYITAVRTAGAAAVAASAVARPESEVLAILGSGAQAHAHLEYFDRCFRLSEIRIAGRSADRAQAVAMTHPKAVVSPSFEAAVRGADIVCCCTNAEKPVIGRNWLADGVHVSSVGRGAEIDASTVSAGTVYVEWRGAATNPPPAGAAELQHIDPNHLVEIGEVLSGRAKGRGSASEITVYKSTGHAVEDAAAAKIVDARARALGRGSVVSI